MKFVRSFFKELFGLFVDDGSLAVGICVLIAIMFFLPKDFLTAQVKAGVLFLSLAILLVENVLRSARKARARRKS